MYEGINNISCTYTVQREHFSKFFFFKISISYFCAGAAKLERRVYYNITAIALDNK